MIATLTSIEIRKVEQSRVSQVDWDNLGFGKVFSDHMCVVEYKDGKWSTPVIQPYGPMQFSPAISALHYGQALFEGLKAFKNDQNEVFVFRPDKNAHRFNVSARRLCMPEFPEDLFVECINQLVNLDKAWIPTKDGESLYIRPHMFAVDEYVGVRPSENYLFVIFTCPVGKYYTGEIKVKIEPMFTRAAKGGTGHAKAAGNYAASLWPTKLAQEAGYNQILWTDGQTHEYFEESGTMNVIFKSGNTVFTPMVSDSILDGVTRDSVLAIAKDWGMEVEERKVSVKEVMELLQKGQLDEAFGAGTAATIAPIRVINYEGNDYQLRPFTEWEFAPKVAEYMDRLKRGMESDTHKWNYKIG
jgi:branched-chain amino acid aminotransferase